MSRQADTRLNNLGLPASRGGMRDLYIPSDFGEAPFKRSKIVQTAIDCLAVFLGVLVICMTALSLPVSLFLLFFVDLR